MKKSYSESYRAAGVDIEAGYKGVQLMRTHVARTWIPGVVSDIGGFGGLFALKNYDEPILVSGTDGVEIVSGTASGIRNGRCWNQTAHCTVNGTL